MQGGGRNWGAFFLLLPRPVPPSTGAFVSLGCGLSEARSPLREGPTVLSGHSGSGLASLGHQHVAAAHTLALFPGLAVVSSLCPGLLEPFTL